MFLKDSRITAVVIALDNERMTTGSVRALKRLYPEMPIFVRATGDANPRCHGHTSLYPQPYRHYPAAH